MSYEEVRIEKICRTCLSEGNEMYSIFIDDSSSTQGLKIFEMIMSCTSLHISENDGLPKQVCSQCALYISSSYAFKSLCEKSDETLRIFLRKSVDQNCLDIKPVLLKSEVVADVIENDPHRSQNPLGESHDMDNKIINNIDRDFESRPISPCVSDIDEEQTVLDQHLNSDTSEDNANSRGKLSSSVLKLEGNPEGQTLHHCLQCNVSFKSTRALKAHCRYHNRPDEFICPMCNKSFTCSRYLLRHKKRHEGQRPHECKECGKCYPTPRDLRIHLHSHTGNKPFSCTLCEKSFAWKPTLTEHMRLHQDEKRFVCSTCGKAFFRYSCFQSHQKTHNRIKNNVCSICGYRTDYSSNLKKHMVIHTGEKPYPCKLCVKTFARIEDYRWHIKTHNGERNYVCKICNKGFYKSYTLKMHARVHTGEKPFSCNICQKSYSQSGSLSTHMKQHSK